MIKEDYKRSAEQFLIGYRSFPDGGKAADSLLKLGVALNKLGKPIEACAVYSKLRSNIKPIADYIEKQLIEEEQKLKCS